MLAGEIRELQAEMADYNTLMDKVNTDTEVGAVLADCAAVSVCVCLCDVCLYTASSVPLCLICSPVPTASDAE